MPTGPSMLSRPYRTFTRSDIGRIPQLRKLAEAERTAMKAVAWVLPFRVNSYVLDELIDWSRIPEDPIYQLVFPQPAMLAPRDFDRMYSLVSRKAPREEIVAAARSIQRTLNPHPAGQLEMNVPRVGDAKLGGVQHKYRETVLFFPAAGQTCHAYCTYCFRWAQFVGDRELRFASRETGPLVRYLRDHSEVTSVLITGGDPMIMKSNVLRRYVMPLLSRSLDHVESIRFGTKAPAYWPYRFTTDPDADELLALFETIVDAGKHVAVMVHYSHPRELDTPAAQEAIQRIRATGATIRCQAPLIRHVNDSAECWARMWRLQVRHGAVPYYMFVERDTGPKNYFEVPLARAFEIFAEAYRGVSGLCRTVRGPSMSATPGKVLVNGVSEVQGEMVFHLEFIQARNPEWVGRPFFARYDPRATWLDDLRPAFGARQFFFQPALRRMRGGRERLHLVGED